jgi:hypothetical protein
MRGGQGVMLYLLPYCSRSREGVVDCFCEFESDLTDHVSSLSAAQTDDKVKGNA